jgi:predicted DNA-binding transcriptional regulator YafY
MPKNKDAVSRYRLLDERLRNKRLPKPTLQMLIDYVSEKMDKTIATRTIQKDLEDMRNDPDLGYHAPIAYDRSTKSYGYKEEDFSIFNNPIDEADLQGLEVAIGILEQFRSLPVIARFEDAILKIAAHLKMNRQELENQGLIKFSLGAQYKGAEHIPEIVDAIKNQEIIRIRYQSFDRPEPKEHWVEPYHLREYNHRFYLIGKSQKVKDGAIITFALDRMDKIWPTNQFFDAGNFNHTAYFQHAIGITVKEEAPEEIILSYTPHQGKYIKSQPLHASQEIIVDTEQECRIRLNLVINHELIMMILKDGERVKVLAPNHLADRVLKEAIAVVARYQGN